MRKSVWGLVALLAACNARATVEPRESGTPARDGGAAARVPEVPARLPSGVKTTLRLSESDQRVLAPGEHVTVPAGSIAELDVGLAIRLSVTGPAVLASDPEGERRVYLQGGRTRLAVSPDSAASPYAFELATGCGVLRVARAAQAEVDLRAGEDCQYAVEAGSLTLTPPTGGAEESRALAAGAALRCASASACVAVARAALDEARTAASPKSDEATPYRRWLAEQLERSATEVARLRAAERVVLASGRAEQGGREALALQRKLALGAADALRARAQLRQLLFVYRATGLTNGQEFVSDSRDLAASSALRRDP